MQVRDAQTAGASLGRAGLWSGCGPSAETLGKMPGSRPRGQRLNKGRWVEQACVSTAAGRAWEEQERGGLTRKGVVWARGSEAHLPYCLSAA